MLDAIGDVALTLLGVAAAMTLWTAAVTMRAQPMASFTAIGGAIGWSVLSGRWLYAATVAHDWISAPWPSQLGLILLALASIVAGWHWTFVALRMEHDRLARRRAKRAEALWD